MLVKLKIGTQWIQKRKTNNKANTLESLKFNKIVNIYRTKEKRQETNN